MEDFAQQQAGLDGGIGVLHRPAATGRRGGAKPLINGSLINPEGEASTLDESGVILIPVAETVRFLGFLFFHTLSIPSLPSPFMQQSRL